MKTLLSSLLVVLSLLPSFAWAAEPVAPQADAQARVETSLLKPLAEAEEHRSRFSRARLPPRERRVRVTQTTPVADAQGREFLAFAIDVRFGAGWKDADVVGCVYPASGEVFVKRGDSFRPSGVLLGKNVKPVAGVCASPDGALAAATP
ncbi:MAG: hypothetical protein JNJ54_10415 [Myxococcaceae bacterium]|nr:hypothetical protein [Myxococcaceae bacterium]